MPEPRIVWAVCTEDSGVPPEVVALYGTEEEARRHVADSYYMVRVKSLPVYETYDDLPEEEKGHALESFPPPPPREIRARPQEEPPQDG